MTVALGDRPATSDPAASRPPNGGLPARRAVARWGVRLFQREWRQQLLVISLLAVAVAATTVGLAIATNAPPSATTTWVLPADDRGQSADIAAIQAAFGPAAVMAHQRLTVPGSLAALDVRSVEPAGEDNARHLRVRSGRLPTATDEVAVTGDVASTYGLHLGGTWQDLGQKLRVVGIVEDPTAYDDRFALVSPGRLPSVDDVTVQIDADISRGRLQSFHLPSRAPGEILGASPTTRAQSATAVLVLATLTLLFVGLVSVASFSVLAHRRQRAIAMLGSVGATDRHIRLVMLANGATVGAVAALIGTAVGLGGWLALSPAIEPLVGHDIDRFALPWWAIAAAVVLAVVAAVLAAWWPARAASRVPIVTALSGRPPQPPPAGNVAAIGVAVLVVGVVLLVFGHPDHGLLIVTGTIATVIGVLLLGPLAIRTLARLAPRLPISGRLALRDLARYQSRSGAALGAATLAIGIASIITISSASQLARESANGFNLPADEMLVHLSPNAQDGGPVPQLSASDLQTVHNQVKAITRLVGARDVLTLDAAVDPGSPPTPTDGGSAVAEPGSTTTPAAAGPTVGRTPIGLVSITPQPGGGQAIEYRGALYVATPQVLAYTHIDASHIDPAADIITSRTNLAHLQLGTGDDRRQYSPPHVQHLALPKGSSEPNTLLTTGAMARLGLQSQPAGWLLRTRAPLTATQIDSARNTAAAAGLTIETRTTHHSSEQFAHDATAAGILFALVVLALTVGLIRSEAANDLRILTAAGATSTTRRWLTATTSGALAVLAALLGIATAYLAMTAFYHTNLHTLTHPPVTDLLAISIGLPAIATLAGWLVAGREPDAIARRPLE